MSTPHIYSYVTSAGQSYETRFVMTLSVAATCEHVPHCTPEELLSDATAWANAQFSLASPGTGEFETRNKESSF